jgi:hypothetical protein
MSRRIAYLALAAVALIATPAAAAQQSRPGMSRHGLHHTAQHRHVSHHRRGLHHGRVPAFASLAEPMTFIDAAPDNHAGSTVIIANPWLWSDPSWKLCQLDPGLDGRADLCGPYSYYPFGAYGYRPFGTYQPERTAGPNYMIAPNARIIRIKADK